MLHVSHVRGRNLGLEGKGEGFTGKTPPPAMVALINVSNSSSPRMASCKCLGVIRLTLRSFAAFPASSRTSAVRYSRIAAQYTDDLAPTRMLSLTFFPHRRLLVLSAHLHETANTTNRKLPSALTHQYQHPRHEGLKKGRFTCRPALAE
jgi:hypothetical protein